MQECKKLIRIRGQRHPSNTIPWAILRQVMTPTLTRAAQSSKDNLQDQLEQQRCRWFAGRPVRPYLHHPTTITLLSRFRTDFSPSACNANVACSFFWLTCRVALRLLVSPGPVEMRVVLTSGTTRRTTELEPWQMREYDQIHMQLA